MNQPGARPGEAADFPGALWDPRIAALRCPARFHQALVAGCRSPWLLHFRAVVFDQAERYRSLGRTYRRAKRDVKLEDVSMPPPEPAKSLKPEDGPTGGEGGAPSGKEVFKGAKEAVFVK